MEKLCRYIARPAISEERLSLNCRGEVMVWRRHTQINQSNLKDRGLTEPPPYLPMGSPPRGLPLTQMEFMDRLVSLVPRPKIHLIRFHGVLAPNYKYRKEIVPSSPTTPSPQGCCGENSENLDTVVRKKRMSWAKLLKRVFNIDIEICIKCGMHCKIISAINDPEVIKKILDHLHFPSTPPTIAPARRVADSADF